MFINLRKEPIDTKEKAIVAIIHTSNSEQVSIKTFVFEYSYFPG